MSYIKDAEMTCCNGFKSTLLYRDHPHKLVQSQHTVSETLAIQPELNTSRGGAMTCTLSQSQLLRFIYQRIRQRVNFNDILKS